MSIICNNREELNDYIKNVNTSAKQPTSLSSVYFLIKDNNGNCEPLYFSPFMDTMYESPCNVYEFAKFTKDEVEDFVKDMYEEDCYDEALEYEMTLHFDGVHYDIENPQTLPFLTFPCEVIDIFSDRECVEWFLKNNKI